MTINDSINELRAIVAKYDTESFVGFFAYFIKKGTHETSDIELNKFDSKMKDFLYLIALNAFAENKGDEQFQFNPKMVEILSTKIKAIKAHYRVQKFADYTPEAAIQEMAFRNHFDNGILSYVEQDLEKIRTIFAPFEDIIIREFGFDIDFLIEVYKTGELISKIKFERATEFTRTAEFNVFQSKISNKRESYEEAFNSMPENIQSEYLSFYEKPHAFLHFSKEDLYLTLPKDKVDRFLDLFSCKITYRSDFQYYTDANPIELAPIIKLSENSYLNVCQKQIPVAVYRFLYTYLINDPGHNERIRKHREKSLERKVAEIFKNFFPPKNAFFYENYFVESNFEQDLLILYKGNALIIETKASKLREPFRDIPKAMLRLKDDFKHAIQYGYNQCRRVEHYFEKDTVFDIMDVKSNVSYTVNPYKIHSVYSIVVTLERFGSLQTDLGLFLEKDEKANFPWSVYVDDLEIFLLTLKHHFRNPQGKFLEYLRKRTLLHTHIYAVDELDVCASFLKYPGKFAENAASKDTLVGFSPLEQAYFDKIYHKGGLRFKEEPMPDFYRYFGRSK